MKEFKEYVMNMAEAMTTQNPEDYTGEDGLLYCGKCHTPKQCRIEEKGFENALFPINCKCKQERIDKKNAEDEHRKHLYTVDKLKREGFDDPAMREWNFTNDNGTCQHMKIARAYVEHFEEMKAGNNGLLLWGRVGTGKSYFAGCIANALMEKESPVRMTNFARILNDLTASFEGRNEYIDNLCSYPLLIIDDFGMERGTEYALEHIYNVIDSRSRSRKPLIVTTNLTLEQLHNPQDIPHTRIYDRLLEMCTPIGFTGESLRRATAQSKLEWLKAMTTALK